MKCVSKCEGLGSRANLQTASLPRIGATQEQREGLMILVRLLCLFAFVIPKVLSNCQVSDTFLITTTEKAPETCVVVIH